MSTSNAQTTTVKKGKARRPAKTERGRAMQSHIDSLGLNLMQAAKRARLDFAALYKAIHTDDPSQLRGEVIASLVGRLGMPLALVCRPISEAIAKSSPPASSVA